MTYFGSPLNTDADQLLAEAFDDIRAQFPDWEPNEANLEVVLAAAAIIKIANVRDLTSDVADEIFRVAGTLLFGVPSIEAAPATADVNVTVVDDAGYTLPAGTEMGAALSGSDSIAFVTTEDLEIPNGDTTGTVAVEATEAGVAGNGLDGDLTLLNPLYEWVTALEFDAASSGGVDAETNDEYLSRLVARLQLQAPRPILARDFAVLAFDVAGVGRATAVDGYNPDDDTYNNERYVTVFVTDDDGQALSGPVKAEVDALLEAMREVNFVVEVEDPTYTTIDVDFEVEVLSGFDQATVEAAVVVALQSYLSPATWGQGVGGDTAVQAPWENEDTVYFLELAQVINQTTGVKRVVSLEFAATGDPLAAADVVMDGPAPLPEPGTIQVAP